MDDLALPGYTSPLWVIAVFFLALAIFHFFLVHLFPRDPLAWKKVDYFWLPLVLIGVVIQVVSAQRDIATNMIDMAKARTDFGATQVQDRLAFGRSEAICRTFIRSEMSPPPEEFNRIQREFNEECQWFQKATKHLPATRFEKRDIISLEDLGIPPKGGDEWAIPALQDAIRRYNAGVAKVNELEESMRRSLLEMLLRVFGPWFIVIGLALRLTKVTGEIKLGK